MSGFGPTLERLWQVIDARRTADPETSYTARLLARGRAKIAQKLGEEAIEAVIEGVRGDKAALVAESADVIYHLMVVWADAGIAPDDVAAELARREGASGIDEKRSRTARGARANGDRMTYDRDNIFARILRGEIPCDKVYEDDHVLAFRDIHPQAPSHVLVIPKGEYVSLDDFTATAPAAAQAALMQALGTVARQEGVARSGVRVIANSGRDAHQDVPHLHFHVVGGRDLRAGLFPR
jgi:histidine triad (HIT) family protein